MAIHQIALRWRWAGSCAQLELQGWKGSLSPISPSLLALSPSPQAHTPSPPCFAEQSTQEHIPKKRKKKVRCFRYVLVPIVQILQGE